MRTTTLFINVLILFSVVGTAIRDDMIEGSVMTGTPKSATSSSS